MLDTLVRPLVGRTTSLILSTIPVATIATTTSPDAFLSSSSSSLLTAVNAWSVTGTGSALMSSDLAANLFASSLLPYLTLLFFLAKPKSATPPVSNFGFQFLLVFVFATIPAGIMAKINYHDMLANVDLYHGVAESFLTITNIFIISGFRQARKISAVVSDKWSFDLVDFFFFALSVSVLAACSGALGIAAPHTEPWNALSFPTWVVHTSSLLEWLIAMKLIWEHAAVSGNEKWKGMTWAMIPSHTSVYA
jgi:hypothetical protein